jgi:hypothetical protein
MFSARFGGPSSLESTCADHHSHSLLMIHPTGGHSGHPDAAGGVFSDPGHYSGLHRQQQQQKDSEGQPLSIREDSEGDQQGSSAAVYRIHKISLHSNYLLLTVPTPRNGLLKKRKPPTRRLTRRLKPPLFRSLRRNNNTEKMTKPQTMMM